MRRLPSEMTLVPAATVTVFAKTVVDETESNGATPMENGDVEADPGCSRSLNVPTPRAFGAKTP